MSRGRPSKPLDPDASNAAWLGAELRARRQAGGLTLEALGEQIGFSAQHISETELAKAAVSRPFIAACDHALDAKGKLLALLPAVVYERAMERHDRDAARRQEKAGDETLGAGIPAPLPWTSQGEAGEDVDPLSRRSLFGAGVGAAVGLNATTAPTASRGIDPELVAHWMKLLRVLGRHDAMVGPHDVLATVRHEITLIAEHRQIARGELRTRLLSVESRWAWFASWLSHDAGDGHGRDSWTDRALRLAQAADDPDAVAWVLMWQSRWATMRHDAARAITLADAARRTRGTTDKIRGLSALKQAHGHALADDRAACERSLADAYGRLGHDARADHLTLWDDRGRQVLADEARCWLLLAPSKAIAIYEEVIRLWPEDRPRGRGIQQARLALACAEANEPERAAVEGIEALDVAQATRSDIATRELTRLDHQLAAYALPEVTDFRAAFAAL